jgi:ribonuclease HI
MRVVVARVSGASMITIATLFTDGASRGNPGPAAIAYRIIGEGGAPLEARVERVPNATNNEAEYAALTAGLQACRRLGIQAVHAVSDSELMVRQIKGSYRAKEPRLAALRDAVRELIAGEFLDVTLEHRPRTDPDIATCDRMADERLTADGFPKEPPDYRRFRRRRRA